MGVNFNGSEIQIIYEDPDLIAINKPAGLRTLPDGYHTDLPCVMHLMNQAFGKVWMLHRLDKETSGVLLVAKNSNIHRLLDRQFANHLVEKTYFAIALGAFTLDITRIEYPLLVDGDRSHRTKISKEGKKAVTVIMEKEIKENSLLKLKIESGYTHQIRSHLSYLGFPLLNDMLYGGQKASTHKLPINRISLHAYQLQFIHPITQSQVIITAPFPEDFTQAMKCFSWVIE